MMNTLHISIVSLREELVKNSENTLEQIAVEGVGQSKLQRFGPDGIRKYTEQLF